MVMTDNMLYFVNKLKVKFLFLKIKTYFKKAFMRGKMRGSCILRGIWNVLSVCPWRPNGQPGSPL